MLNPAQNQQVQDAFTKLKNSINNQIDEFDLTLTQILSPDNNVNVNKTSSQNPQTLDNQNQTNDSYPHLSQTFAQEELDQRQEQIENPNTIDFNNEEKITPQPSAPEPTQLSETEENPVSFPFIKAADPNLNPQVQPISPAPIENLTNPTQENIQDDFNPEPSLSTQETPVSPNYINPNDLDTDPQTL